MKCFIGGSGSTGSSVLANVLNRHSEVFCGPETYLFSKYQLYENWEKYKNELIDGRIKSLPWHRFSRTLITNEAYGWDRSKLRELITYSHFIEEFADEFFRHAASNLRKKYWIEKTPSNAYGFQDLPEHFPHCFLVHTMRNPYDTIASLNNRGFSIYYATCLYLVNTCVALAMRKYKHYIQVVYEDLVDSPDTEVKALCNQLGIKFEPKMLKAVDAGFDDDIDSWELSEHDVITAKGLGTFAKASRFVQEEIVYMINALRLSPYYEKKFQCDVVDIPTICEMMDFSHYEDGGFMNIFQLNIDRQRDKLIRFFKSYPNFGKKYPVILRV
jgi:hypothetical protein